MARVHFWSADQAGSSLYRAQLPAMALSWLGHTVSVDPRLPDRRWEHDGWRYLDTVVGCRVAKPKASEGWRRLKDRGVRLVMDLDDDYFNLDPTNRTAYQLWTQPTMRQGLIDNLALADVVTCCSERQADVLRDYAADVRVIPNGLPAQYLGHVRDYDPDTVRVGWAGTASTVAELPLAARALNRIAAYQPPRGDVVVRLVGVTPDQAVAAGVRPAGSKVGALGWVNDPNHYFQAVSAFDIWVAPYRDTVFNAAKYETKFLESSVFGIPLIASAIEPYRRVIRHGENGFLVPPGQEHLFGRYLKTLVDDPDLRQSIGMAARAQASGSILQAINRQWEQALTSPDREAVA